MGVKTSVVQQTDFLDEHIIKTCHRPTKLTGARNIAAFNSLRERGLSGITSEELAAEHQWLTTAAGVCLTELRWLGLARGSGSWRNRKTVYILTEKGLVYED